MPKKKNKLTAKTSDKYDLYQRAVQCPENEVKFMQRMYRKYIGGDAVLLREDFCGTAAICCAWVRSKTFRKAIGVDLDPEPLEWGRQHNMAELADPQIERITLLQDDVRKINSVKADVLAAENFSYFCFKTRDELRAYLNAAYQNIAQRGVMVLDLMGGADCHKDDVVEKSRKDGFTYVWEHEWFNPINNETLCHISFHFRNGSKMKRVFSYDWRLWSIAEVRELLYEVGFGTVDVYWEGTDEDGEGNGVFRKRESAEADECFVAYIVAVKQ